MVVGSISASIYSRWLTLRLGCVVLLASVICSESDTSNNAKRLVAMYPPSMYNQELYDVFGAPEFLNARPSRDLDIAEEKRGFDDGGASMPGVLRFGKRSQSFIRFGKRAMLLDKKEMPGVLRFGKRSGDVDEEKFQIKKNVPGVLRFGKRDYDVPGVLRFGKREYDVPGVLRFGKRGGDFDVPGVLRFGKRGGDDSEFGVPGVLRFGKKSEMPGVLRFGKRATPGVLRFGR